ncbi:hypothetical protein HY797_02815 [Candidatus Falkowbacteria bacterium]|nr:hypothetical protein [Candidatus Falkowbacteria bacterium]
MAKEMSYRDTYRHYVGGELVPTLSDEESAIIVFAAKKSVTNSTEIMNQLPEGIKAYFKTASEMKTNRGLFFMRFALLAKSPEDGMLWGTGIDEIYYVLATWDGEGCDLWLPKCDLYDRPVIR